VDCRDEGVELDVSDGVQKTLRDLGWLYNVCPTPMDVSGPFKIPERLAFLLFCRLYSEIGISLGLAWPLHASVCELASTAVSQSVDVVLGPPADASIFRGFGALEVSSGAMIVRS
jgi:hypothetical protein